MDILNKIDSFNNNMEGLLRNKLFRKYDMHSKDVIKEALPEVINAFNLYYDKDDNFQLQTTYASYVINIIDVMSQNKEFEDPIYDNLKHFMINQVVSSMGFECFIGYGKWYIIEYIYNYLDKSNNKLDNILMDHAYITDGLDNLCRITISDFRMILDPTTDCIHVNYYVLAVLSKCVRDYKDNYYVYCTLYYKLKHLHPNLENIFKSLVFYLCENKAYFNRNSYIEYVNNKIEVDTEFLQLLEYATSQGYCTTKDLKYYNKISLEISLDC